MSNCSTVRYFGGAFFMDSQAGNEAAPTVVNSTVERTREYLTGSEVEALMAAARKSSRYGQPRCHHDPDRLPAWPAGVRGVRSPMAPGRACRGPAPCAPQQAGHVLSPSSSGRRAAGVAPAAA